MPLTGPRSDTSSPRGPPHRPHTQGFPPGQAAGGPASSLYKMDAIMFPSEDPFAYPNQPLLNPASHHHTASQAPQPGAAGQSRETMQFYIPNMYEGIEGQLLDPMPSYLMQQGPGQAQRQPPPQHPAAQMYNSPSMLQAQQHHHPHHHQPLAQHPHHQQHPHPHHPQHPQHPQHQHGMDEMLTDPTFRGDWDDMLEHTDYR